MNAFLVLLALGACGDDRAILDCATRTTVDADDATALGFSPRELAEAHAAWRASAVAEGDAPASDELAGEGPFAVSVAYDAGADAYLLEPTGTCSGTTSARLSVPVVLSLSSESGELAYTGPHRIEASALAPASAVWAGANGDPSQAAWPAWAEDTALPACAGEAGRRLALSLAEAGDAPRLDVVAYASDPAADCDVASTLASARLALVAE